MSIAYIQSDKQTNKNRAFLISLIYLSVHMSVTQKSISNMSQLLRGIIREGKRIKDRRDLAEEL